MSLKKMLIAEEGSVDHAYPDSLGYLTIGVGRLIDKRKGGKLSQEEIDFLLENDLKQITLDTHQALPWLKEHQIVIQDAILAMRFQLGLKGLLSFRVTLSLIKARAYSAAADQMLKSKWAKQTPTRARRISNQIRFQRYEYPPGA